MSHDPSDPIEEFDQVTFELASGDQVKVGIGVFWCKRYEYDPTQGQKPFQYFAIRFYTNENNHSRRLKQFHQLQSNKDFERRHSGKILAWLVDHANSRECFDHDNTDDFLELFESVLDKIHAEDEDMIEHLERLPSFTVPAAFDRVDDSIFTDQSDPEID
ncbi:MAG: hypothetical protein P1U58_18785 [Verrucomicrobiales bacterium]|nr:hypothetical protein [Verrucomicrobiales bacterium]